MSYSANFSMTIKTASLSTETSDFLKQIIFLNSFHSLLQDSLPNSAWHIMLKALTKTVMQTRNAEADAEVSTRATHVGAIAWLQLLLKNSKSNKICPCT